MLAFILLLIILASSNCVRAFPVNQRYLPMGLLSMLVSQSVKHEGARNKAAQELMDSEIGWVDPRILGGRLLDASGLCFFTTADEGEPLNLIISGNSDPYVLSEAGFSDYIKSLGFSTECLGVHIGNIHQADLGDGNGRHDEQVLARQYYFMGPLAYLWYLLGKSGWYSCSIFWSDFSFFSQSVPCYVGGNHFRAWKQDGHEAASGAWFLGASKEENSRKNHKIIPNGYNIGRDFLVAQAVSSPTHWNSMWWQAELDWVEGLLEPGSEGVNHGIEQDGLVAVLTVSRL
ncbi:hypothetical protein D9757_007033 [Collybiopsis confluens]|uniref:Uncharacterized protein n=1 Tax=Collybiopsis confluens TaxID=2823264 RepID=A0A8H5HCA4_9AGAR|nr:hypothetical protein D9757_007033 [Collybiopsis confluens]